MLARLPRLVAGIDEITRWWWTTGLEGHGTAEVAQASGTDQVIRLKRHQGLAAAFQIGMDAALRAGADIIVTIDADGQFDGTDVPLLVTPLLAGEADIAIGDRDLRHVAYFSRRKRLLQRIGSAETCLSGFGNSGVRQHVGISGLQPRRGDEHGGLLRVYLHPGHDHSSWTERAQHSRYPSRHQAGAPPVAPLFLRLDLRKTSSRVDLP